MGIKVPDTGTLGYQPGVGLGPFSPQVGAPQLRYPSELLFATVSVGPTYSVSLLLLPALMWLLLYILQLDFRRFCMMVVL